MDIRQLRNFLGVLHARNITKAAHTLGVAQPALGLQIRNLEEELGTPLFVRHARGVVPTEAGDLLARHAELLLQQFEAVRQDLLDFGATPRGRVVLGMANTTAQILIADTIERCRRNYPGIELVVTDGRSRQLTEMITEDKLDLAVTLFPTSIPEVVSVPLLEEELLVVHGPGRGKLGGAIDAQALFDLTLILPSRPHNVRELVENVAHQACRKLKLYCEVDSAALIKDLVSRGVAASVLPLGAVKTEADAGRMRLQRIRLGGFQRILYLTHSSRRPMSKAIKAVCAEVKATAAELAADPSYGWRMVTQPGPLAHPRHTGNELCRA